ncbi:MAG TPA: hypothetical protein VFT98_12520 [Myxococcota bacterium]|nr:hypothetical protein [Myxococcota bacterium]
MMRSMVVCLAFAFASTSALAQVAGEGDFSGDTAKLRARGCGKDRVGAFGEWALLGDGSWTGTVDSVVTLSGTHIAQGSSNRIARLTFDAESKLAFDAALEAWATGICTVPVTLDAPSAITHFNVKLNKRRTRAKLTLRAVGTGSTSEGSSAGRFKAIVRGPWTEAAQ